MIASEINKMQKRRVVISGLGTVTPFGIGIKSFWQNLYAGKSAAGLIENFDVSGLPTRFAAQVPYSDNDLDDFIENKKASKTMSRSIKLAIIAAQEAIEDSKLNLKDFDPYKFGVSIGAGGLGLWDLDYSHKMLQIVVDSYEEEDRPGLNFSKVWQNVLERVHPLTPLKALPNMAAAHIAINYNARGHCQTISTACTSSTQAIGEAYRLIAYGFSDAMVTGGSDAMINPNGMVAFSTLGVMSQNNEEFETAIRPFDKRRDGFMIGEGGAIFILEEYANCLERGGIPYAEIIGYACTCDAYRLTDEPPEAWGSIHAIKSAISDAGIPPHKIDYINAHGTGTPMNDKNETYAIKNVFQEKAYKIPVSSTKSMVGHLVAAAGAVEFAACVLAMEKQIIPPTINYQEPDPECDLDYVPNQARQARLNVILSNSFGFGGQNACLLIKKLNHRCP